VVRGQGGAQGVGNRGAGVGWMERTQGRGWLVNQG
jgi:hypothetical protein